MNISNPFIQPIPMPGQINPAMYSITAEIQQKICRVVTQGSIDELARPIPTNELLFPGSPAAETYGELKRQEYVTFERLREERERYEPPIETFRPALLREPEPEPEHIVDFLKSPLIPEPEPPCLLREPEPIYIPPPITKLPEPDPIDYSSFIVRPPEPEIPTFTSPLEPEPIDFGESSFFPKKTSSIFSRMRDEDPRSYDDYDDYYRQPERVSDFLSHIRGEDPLMCSAGRSYDYDDRDDYDYDHRDYDDHDYDYRTEESSFGGLSKASRTLAETMNDVRENWNSVVEDAREGWSSVVDGFREGIDSLKRMFGR